jgi:hypothetical protein
VSIAITLLTAFIILPILHKIERSKEKVLMIYTELKKEQIETLSRNIKVFFIKLANGTQPVSGSLSYQTSGRQFSNKGMTRKFTMNPSSNRAKKGEAEMVDEFGFIAGSRIGQIGDPGNELLELGSPRKDQKKIGFGGTVATSVDPFAALYPASMLKQKEASTAGKGGTV